MIEILNDAKNKFQAINTLLKSTNQNDQTYWDALSEATQSAYIIMNQGMCESLSVCQQCAEHRNYLHEVIQILEPLAHGESVNQSDLQKLDHYPEVVSLILDRISTVS